MATKQPRSKPKTVVRRPAAASSASRKARRTTTSKSASERATANPPLFVVGIGASAGGLEALQTFFDHVPTNGRMAFVVVTHLSPDRPTLLPELLARRTSMPVAVAKKGCRVEPNHVYVSPPGVYLGLLQGAFLWMKLGAKHEPPLPIDFFFRSLAQDQQERAICIVLSGTGTDGTLGLSAIKANAGIVIVQDERTAQHAGMPHSATATHLADYVLAPEDMPARLQALTQSSAKPTRARPTNEPLEHALPEVFLLLRNRLGHDFSGYKPNTMKRRIERRMRVHQLEQPSQYLSLLQDEPQELDLLFQELLITVTQFFRDPQAFAALEAPLAKRIQRSSQDQPLRIWVPGCSTGEEPYSIAMLVIELLEQAGKRQPFQIFATDLDSRVIEVARTGLYPAGIASDVGRERLDRFFVAKGSSYQISKTVRDHVVFATHNVLRDPPFTKLDLLSCRNLLIYLSNELQQLLFPLFHYALAPDALLWLGTSENATTHSELFSAVDRQCRLYQRRQALAPATLFLSGLPRPPRHELTPDKRLGTLQPSPSSGIAQTMERILLERFAPPTLVVSERGDIAFVHGRTGSYLELNGGEPRSNAFAMSREGLRASLQSAVRAAITDDREIIRSGISVKTNGGFEAVTLTACRIIEPESLRGLIRVSFTTTDAADKTTSNATLAAVAPTHSESVQLELAHARDSLQGTLAELNNSNEELKSANEELQSTNEELQSTNEELESSKEELQSLNEELQTVNAELQLKIDQIAQVNDDMQNMLNGTEIATLFLDSELRIKRFTEQARRVVRLIASDVGRPIADIVTQIRYPDLTHDAERVLRTLLPHEIEVEALDGRWLLVRILPYRTGHNMIDGVVITFVDIDRVKRAEVLAASRAFAESIVQTVREPLLVLDDRLYIVASNRAFSQLIKLEQRELRDRALADVATADVTFSRLSERLRDVITRGATVEAFQLTREFDFTDPRPFELYARRLVDLGAGTLGQILVVLNAIESDRNE